MTESPNEWWSHPPEDGEERVLLEDHLEDVAERVGEVVPETAETPAGESLREVVRLLAGVHDFGKLTTWFQQHVGKRDGDPPRDKLRYHSQLGALLGYYVLEARGFYPETCLAGYVAVAKHHQPLPDVTDYVFDQTDPCSRSLPSVKTTTAIRDYSPAEMGERVDLRTVQAANVDRHASAFATDLVEELTDGTGDWADFVARLRDEGLLEEVSGQVSDGGPYTPQPTTDAVSADFYACLLQTWSALVLADKTSAANVSPKGYEAELPPKEALDRHVEGLGTSRDEDEAELNDLRKQARREVLDNVETFDTSDSSVATLTLPTGMGKTLTGLGAAMKLRDLTDRKRIVYALPFTSIVDQVVDVVTGIDGFGTDGTDQVLTVDHHLAETAIELDEDDAAGDAGEGTDADADVETMLGGSWRSGLTVTTFVQLFESLAGPGNRQSMKLPALYDSVVIVDEPQALPHTWWPLVRRLADVLTEEYGATVIAMTATQPGLFEDDSVELVEDPEEYFGRFERVEYDLHESVLGFDEETETIGYGDAAGSIATAAESEGDVLAVCNTIDSARELTEAVADSASEVVDVGDEYADLLGGGEAPTGEDVAGAVVEATDGVALLHLTTRIRPRDRRVLLDAAQSLLDSDVTLVAVTTQLVEAGVDISFDRVFRDFAPMDSVVQAAGRCNRSLERDLGRVTVWWLDAPESKEYTPAQAVYELTKDSLLSMTKNSLDDVRDGETLLSERTVTVDGVHDYYERLSGRRPGKEGWVKLVDDAKVRDLSAKSLIEQRLAVDVVVCRTEDECECIERIREAWDRRDFDLVDDLLDELRPLQVSVPIYTRDSPEAEKVQKLERIHADSDIRRLDARTDEYDDFFDSTTGLMLPEDTVERRFL